MPKLIKLNKPFTCQHCGQKVPPHPEGGCRDHCPFCLYSKHVDDKLPGDRKSKCQGTMEPIAAAKDAKRRMVIFYRCENEDKLFRVKMAPDDNWNLITELAGYPEPKKEELEV